MLTSGGENEVNYWGAPHTFNALKIYNTSRYLISDSESVLRKTSECEISSAWHSGPSQQTRWMSLMTSWVSTEASLHLDFMLLHFPVTLWESWEMPLSKEDFVRILWSDGKGGGRGHGRERKKTLVMDHKLYCVRNDVIWSGCQPIGADRRERSQEVLLCCVCAPDDVISEKREDGQTWNN